MCSSPRGPTTRRSRGDSRGCTAGACSTRTPTASSSCAPRPAAPSTAPHRRSAGRAGLRLAEIGGEQALAEEETDHAAEREEGAVRDRLPPRSKAGTGEDREGDEGGRPDADRECDEDRAAERRAEEGGEL